MTEAGWWAGRQLPRLAGGARLHGRAHRVPTTSQLRFPEGPRVRAAEHARCAASSRPTGPAEVQREEGAAHPPAPKDQLRGGIFLLLPGSEKRGFAAPSRFFRACLGRGAHPRGPARARGSSVSAARLLPSSVSAGEALQAPRLSPESQGPRPSRPGQVGGAWARTSPRPGGEASSGGQGFAGLGCAQLGPGRHGAMASAKGALGGRWLPATTGPRALALCSQLSPGGKKLLTRRKPSRPTDRVEPAAQAASHWSQQKSLRPPSTKPGVSSQRAASSAGWERPGVRAPRCAQHM